MGDIGKHEKEVEFLPLEEPAEEPEPMQAPAPQREPEKVPA